MSYFDLLFLASVALSIVTLIAAAMYALRGRRRRAKTILKVWGAYVAVYMTIGIAVDFLQPRRTIKAGDLWCFDHWCLTVENVAARPGSDGVSYDVTLRIFNSSRRVVQWAAHPWVYLIDDKGRLYPPDPAPTAVPLDVKLQPEQSVVTSRVFRVPASVTDLGLITGHGGNYCGVMSVAIIGAASCLFNKPPMIRILPAGGL